MEIPPSFCLFKEVAMEIPPCFYLYKDGSIRRAPSTLCAPPPDDAAVSSKSLVFNAELGLWVRIAFPTSLLHHPHSKLPLVIDFHGGGFLFGSPDMSNHAFRTALVMQSHSIWISPSFRFAPEHRLPAAFDDGLSALRWLQSQALLQANAQEHLMDDPLLSHIDFSRCFISGASSGGVLAHHVAMAAMNKPLSSASWKPMCIKGLILVQPGFLRGSRTHEEIQAVGEMDYKLQQADMVLELALPQGAKKDHPFFNPLLGFASMKGFVLPKTLVAIAEEDPLRFLEMEYVQALKDAGCCVDSLMLCGVDHAFYIEHPESEQGESMRTRISSFINEL